MFKADDEMMRVIENLVRWSLRLVIESPQGAGLAAALEQFWIEIQDAPALLVHEPQVGIAGALVSARRKPGKITLKSLHRVERILHGRLEERAHFVDAPFLLRRTFRRVHALKHGIKSAPDLGEQLGIDDVGRMKRQHLFARGRLHHVGEWDGGQFPLALHERADQRLQISGARDDRRKSY